MANIRVPKNMSSEAVLWALRHGVVQGMRSRGRFLPRQGHSYVIAPSRVVKLADRVRMEWLRRHPASHDSGMEECDERSLRCAVCGWLLSDFVAHVGATYEDHSGEAEPARSWRDRHGDVWTLGNDRMLHTPETAPFAREHVEKKWGPLMPEPHDSGSGFVDPEPWLYPSGYRSAHPLAQTHYTHKPRTRAEYDADAESHDSGDAS